MNLVISCVLFCSVLSVSMGCRCAPLSVAKYYCNSDFAIQITVKSEKHDTEDELNSWYDINVVKVYKSNFKSNNALKSGRVWTSENSESCGRVFEMNGNYVITGYYDEENDRLRTHTCTYGRPLNDLNKNDKRFYELGYKSIDCTKFVV